MGGFFAALAAALWAYDGWEDLNRVGSEVQEPQRNIPLALIGGTILVGGMYLLFSAVCFYACRSRASRVHRTWRRTWWRASPGTARLCGLHWRW